MKTKLDSFERQIENAASSYRPLSKKKQRKVEALIARVRKGRTVNIRIAESVLEELKRRSQEEGLPYQTLISSILHKYVTNRLVDEEAIRKSLRLLQQQA
ncbi:MAG TPA: antitoxin [Bacteroidota bacterium]